MQQSYSAQSLHVSIMVQSFNTIIIHGPLQLSERIHNEPSGIVTVILEHIDH